MKVLTVGTATRDVIVSSRLFRIVHDPAHLERLGFPTGEAQCFALGGKIEVGEPILALGGGAANAAVTFARQGFSTQAFIKIGKDKNAEDVVEHLRREKVKVLPAFDQKIGTAYSVVLLLPSGERTVLHYRGASEQLRLPEAKRIKLGYDVAYFIPGNISFEVISYLTKTLKKRGALVAINPSRYYIQLGAKKLKPILDNVDVILVNREEGAALTGKKYEDEKGIFKKFDELVGGLAVMTDGPKGVIVSSGKKIYKAGIYKEKRVADRTGAGDSFGAGFVAGLCHEVRSMKHVAWDQEQIKYAIRLGSANATSNVEQVGAQTGILTKKEFEAQARWKELRITIKDI